MYRKKVFWGLLIALVIAVFLAPLASSNPDGLERVAEDYGFSDLAEGKQLVSSPIPDYLFPGVENEVVATALAGVAGVFLSFTAVYVVTYLVKRRVQN